MSIYGDKAYETFFKGYNCAQCVAIAFAPVMHMTESQAARMSSGFGGGFGRLREVCGAFSGITFVLSTLYGSDDPAQKTATTPRCRRLPPHIAAATAKTPSFAVSCWGCKRPRAAPLPAPAPPNTTKSVPARSWCA